MTLGEPGGQDKHPERPARRVSFTELLGRRGLSILIKARAIS